MGRILSIILSVIICVSVMSVATRAESAEVLNVFNWGEYISDGSEDSLDVNAEFEKYYEETYGKKITVNYSNYDTNETMYAKIKSGGSRYDVIIPSDYMISRLISEELLVKLNKENIPELSGISNDVLEVSQGFDPGNLYSVPYTWGETGIIYNKTMVDGEITSWKDMWDEKYAGKILMFNNPRDGYAIALSILGYSYNTTDYSQWNEATELLKQQKPVVQAYVADEVFNKMECGEAAIASYYVGDYISMRENNPDLEFCLPEEGFNVFVDSMCIPTCAQNIPAAEAYINFMCTYEIALANAEYIGYASPVDSVRNDTEYTYYQDEDVYPDSETLARGEEFLHLSEDIQRLMDNGWADVKRTEINGVTSVLLALFFVVALIFLIFKKARNKKLYEE